jgi:adenosylhomocysteine nucleosidase
MPEFAGIVRFGRILTSDSFMSDPERVRRAAAAFPEAFASDMEGAAAAQAAYNLEIPFLNVRSISDIGGEDAAQSFDENIDLAAERAARFFSLLVEEI